MNSAAIPASVSGKLQKLMLREHIHDLIVIAPYTHLWFSDDHILHCDTEETELKKQVTVFNDVINHYAKE